MEASDPLELRGIAAPPTTNGEVVFDAPWQGRVFGMARSLAERGVYSWDEFRSALIAAIERDAHRASQRDAHRASSAPATFAYYDRFLEAFATLLADRGLIADSELDERFKMLTSRPHGHDHDDRHDDHAHDDHAHDDHAHYYG